MNFRSLSPALLTLLVFLLAQLVGAALLTPFGADPEQMPAGTFSLILMAVDIIAVLLCIFPLRFIRPVTRHDVAAVSWQHGSIAIAAGVLGAIGISILTEDVPLPQAMQELSLRMAHTPLGLLALIIVGPLAEELLFREAIEGEMLRRGARPWVAIAVSAIAFSAIHLNLAQGLYALPLAILFGIIYLKTRNILITTVLHILNNSIAALQLRFMGEGLQDVTYADLLGSNTAAIAAMLLCIALSIGLTILFWRTYPTDR